MKKVFSILTLSLVFAFTGCDGPTSGNETITSIIEGEDGKCTVTLSDGSVWRDQNCGQVRNAYIQQQQRLQEEDGGF